MRPTPRLQTTALIAALASIYPMQVLANAGVTQFSVGEVSVQRANNNIPLASGSRIESGDQITTGSTGRTQLRFTDGGMVSLQPNSQFKINNYSDAAAGKQDSFLVDLARGGMRALTGLIGKRNRDNYKVTTTTATIGIRGSGFSMAYNSDGTLGVTTEQDAIEVCTQAGCIGLNLGESALVTSATALPTRTNQRAHWNPPHPRRLVTARNEDTDDEGKNKYIINTGVAFAGAGIGQSGSDPRLYLNGTAVRDANGNIVGYLGQNNDRASGGAATRIGNSVVSSVDGGQMVLGTWENVNWTGRNAGALQQSAFVIGQVTPESAFARSTELRGRYDLAAGTPVFSSNGSAGTLLSSSNVIVDFRSAFGAMDINLDVSMPGNYMFASASSVSSPGGMTHNLRGSATVTGVGFSGPLGVSNSYGYFEGTGSATGFFGGPQAGQIGLSFTGNTANNGTIAGAGVFARGQAGAIPQVTLDPYLSDLKLQVLDGSNYFYTDQYYYNNTFYAGESGDVNAQFSGTQLLSWINQSNGNDGVRATGSTNRLYGAIGQPGQQDFLGWGSWATGERLSANTTALTDVHYIIGKPSYYVPFSGTAVYGLIGGTVPTSTLGGNGELLSTSNLQVNFGTQSLTANINLQFGSTDASFSQVGAINGSTFRSTGCGNNFFSGMFVGANAGRAGMVYGSNNHPTLGTIRGAAGFQMNSYTPGNISFGN